MEYEKPEVTDHGSIAEHTFVDDVGDCFPGASPPCGDDDDGVDSSG